MKKQLSLMKRIYLHLCLNYAKFCHYPLFLKKRICFPIILNFHYLRNKRSSAKICPVQISLLSIYIKTLWFNCFNGKKSNLCVSEIWGQFRIEISYALSEDYIGIFIFFAIQIPKKYICLECKGTILMEIPWCNNN